MRLTWLYIKNTVRWCCLLAMLGACSSVSKKAKSFEDLPKEYTGLKKMVLVPTEVAGHEFYIDVIPVTYQDFRKYVQAGGTIAAYWDEATYNKSLQPVTGINWYHAVDYCNWRSKMEGLSPAYVPSGKLDTWGYPGWRLNKESEGYRLPFESEFMTAARGGKGKRAYPWGDRFDPAKANYDNERGVKIGKWWRLAKVNELPKNDFGIRGMSGNVWHWCNDWHTTNRTKVLKGGSWGSINPKYLQINYRSFSAPSNYNFDIGFRCVRPAYGISRRDSTAQKAAQRKFYQYQTSHYNQPLRIDYYGTKFTQRLATFLGDYFPQSLYFLEQVDAQPKITPLQMAQAIVSVTQQHNINPLFLTAIMVSESGLGSCSFPRWYNNPMAFHWQNRLMVNGLPTYQAMPGKLNRKYRNLKAAFQAFCYGIRRNIYYAAARENLYDFHMVYVGYESDVWLYTIARVFKDVAGIRFEADEPMQNAGAMIYHDWEQIKQRIKTPRPTSLHQYDKTRHTSPPQTSTKTISGRYYLIAGSYTHLASAQQKLQHLRQAGFANPRLLQSQRRLRVAFDAGYQTRQLAVIAKQKLKTTYTDVWIWRGR
ncbi:SUMF1/EgtB/PvdO family nonheme iron enzyme [uncultured Microscilla sp.]|uniref:SUMF1/EgtB/PvdO family nonheme iron enzyme n=1 Tax=uncultured Microscilla sp. TaxID=432653 RepID=UPI0026226075|nr:SUMF1/EgtB/PvdO family nonheme iron enzyme [uncultured Microscilla sp.]